jgi:hypothetical protein
MTEPTERPNEKDLSGHRPDGSPEPRTPRWVKAFVITAVILVVAFAVLHLTGGGMGSHTP